MTCLPASRRLGALLLALLLLALAVAIYSPLHRHEGGNPYRCSLNNIEHCVTEEASTFFVLAFSLALLLMVQVWRPIDPALALVRCATSRGPPAF